MGRGRIRTVLALAVLALPVLLRADDPDPKIFHTERAYYEEVARLQAKIDQARQDSRDEEARVVEATNEVLNRESRRQDLNDRIRRLQTEVADLEGAFKPSDPHLERAIKRLEGIVKSLADQVRSEPKLIEQYDFYNARLQELKAQKARQRAAQVDVDQVAAKRREITAAQAELDSAATELADYERRLERAKADYERALAPMRKAQRELADLQSRAPTAMAGVKPPILVGMDARKYSAAWVGKERSDREALERLELEMRIAERKIIGVKDALREVEQGQNREEDALVASSNRYVALAGRMEKAGYVDAILRTTVETAGALSSVGAGSKGNPVAFLINAGIEVGTRVGTVYFNGVPSQRMAVAADELLQKRQELAGNAVIEAYRIYGLDVPEMRGASGAPDLPSKSSATGQTGSANGPVWNFVSSTGRIKDAVKSNVQDTITDIADRLIESGLASSVKSSVVPVDAQDITMNMIRRANPNVTAEAAETAARMIQQSARSQIAWSTIKDRFALGYRDLWKTKGFRNKLREFFADPNSIRSAGKEIAFSAAAAGVDALEDSIRDGIMSEMVAEEIVWLQIRKRYHTLGAHRQFLMMTQEALEEYLNETRAEYARIAGREGGRTLTIARNEVFPPGEYWARLEFSDPIIDPSITSDGLEILDQPVLEDDRHFVRFHFRVPEPGKNPAVTAGFAISARDDDTDKVIDGNPETMPFFDSGSNSWQLYERSPDRTHRIRLVGVQDGTSISILLDDSGSMEGGKFQQARNGIKGLLDRLGRRKRAVEVALWTFSGGSAPVVGFTQDLAAVRAAVDAASPNSSTPLARTISASGEHLFTQAHFKGRVLYIFSDGEDSEGGNPKAAIDALRRRAVRAEQVGW